MDSCGRFGPLLGVIYIGDVYCKFLVYAARNAEVLTCHEIKLTQISSNPGWLEFDPVDIWKCTVECIEVATQNLIILDINPKDILALGISNQRGTTVIWNRHNGSPLYNAIAWSDTRTSAIIKKLLSGVKGNQNYLKSVCGLPISTCFSAVKIKWLMENNKSINQLVLKKSCCFGTLDSWILWNLTGGIQCGVHVIGVTNASYTMLMNIRTLQWDSKLCSFFRIPQHILPNIKSCSEIYGFIHDGPLQGVPIASCMGDQSAAVLGQLCTYARQTACTIDEGCFILSNTVGEIVDSDNGLISSVAFKLGAKEKACYALEGSVANAGSAITWLKENLSLNVEIANNNNFLEMSNPLLMMNSNNSSTRKMSITDNLKLNDGANNVVFVPAFNGIFSPFWKHDARGLILGLNNQTKSEHITRAAYEAICFQIRSILHSFNRDMPTWKPLEKLIIGGEFSENSNFLQLLADIVGIIIERPQTTSPSCLGVVLAAGIAIGVLSLKNSRAMYTPPVDLFYPATTSNQRDVLYKRWQYAIKKCIDWDNFENYEHEMEIFSKRDKDPHLTVQCSIPGGIFVTSSFVILLIAKILQSQNIT